MEVRIRSGFREDLPDVLQLIRELAEYEKAPGEVEVTLQDLERDGFGDHPVFRFFIAEVDGKIQGMALYYVKYSTWKGRCIFLEDIIVRQDFRRLRIGRQLFEAVIGVAKDMRVRRLEWQVLDWNTPAIKFYEKYQAEFLKEWVSCRLVEKQIRAFSHESI
ncbi:MAG: GNAT family N-acetyltransferase [Bacteroidia bacterium]|nr:GNAT family N-acetyltransferase [Bacteroidia bacterium]